MAISQYNKLVWFPSGLLARNVPAQVFPENSNVLATLWTDAAGTIPLANPTATTNAGVLSFWAADGDYWIHMDSESFPITVGPGAAGITLSGTVVTETTYGQASTAGAAGTASRGDHTHGTPPLPTVGTTAGTYAAGNDARLSDARVPTGPAGGDLGGTYPDPDVVAINGVTVTGVPAAGQIITATGAGAASWQTPSAGSPDGTARVRITNDDLSGLPGAAAWTVVATSLGTQLVCPIAAVVGDRIEVYGNFMYVGSHFLDWVLLDSAGVISEYATSEGAAPPIEGNPTMYPSRTYGSLNNPEMFTVGAGHLNAGFVTIGLAHQGSAGGASNIVYAHTSYPWRLRLKNIR